MTPPFDIVMLSYDEPLAHVLHTRLESTLKRPVKRLHGVAGMRRAYRLTAELADTEEFLIADGDFEILGDFGLDDVRPLEPGTAMRVWAARNDVANLVYGYGGLKLISRGGLRALGEAVDVLAGLTGRVEFEPRIAGTTRFDQNPYLTWKAAFRECAMLQAGSEYGMTRQHALKRLRAWTESSGGQYAPFAREGAQAGIRFGQEYRNQHAALDNLNSPAWLRERFAQTSRANGETS